MKGRNGIEKECGYGSVATRFIDLKLSVRVIENYQNASNVVLKTVHVGFPPSGLGVYLHRTQSVQPDQSPSNRNVGPRRQRWA